MSEQVLARVLDVFSASVQDSHKEHGDETVVIAPSAVVELARFLRDDSETQMEMLIDLTAVDYLGVEEPRFQVVYHFYSLSKNHRLRAKVMLEDESPNVDSITSVYKSALWMEREAWDLYGIHFEGHPDLRRILLYPEFEGHPLRKDYPLEGRQPLIPPRPGQKHL